MSELKNKAKVIMLPTKKAENVSRDLLLCIKSYKDNTLTYDTDEGIKGQLKMGVSLYAKDDFYQSQHLYVVSDEHPHQGNWCITNYGIDQVNSVGSGGIRYFNKLSMCWNKHEFESAGVKKIIGITDKDLWSKTLIEDTQTFLNKPLPTVSNSFINKYIEQYNAGTPIVDVLVEFNEPVCKCNSVEKLMKCCFATNGGEDCQAPNPNNDFYGLRPKLRGNELIITKVKNNWDTSDVEQMMSNIALDAYTAGRKNEHPPYYMDYIK